MVTKKTNFKKGSWENKILLGLLALFNVLVIAFLVFSNIKVYSQSREIKEQYVVLGEEIKDLERKNQELQEMFAFLSEDGYAEAYLRERGMYQKEGEHVVVIQRDDDSEAKIAGQEIEVPMGTASILDQVKNFFKSIFR